MDKHKAKALEEGCLCTECVFRFQCFTRERIFSDPMYQGLFEAMMALGKSKEEAVDAVANEIKWNMRLDKTHPISGCENDGNGTYPWIYYWHDYTDNISFDGNQITYTMSTGEAVSWNANEDGVGDVRVHY